MFKEATRRVLSAPRAAGTFIMRHRLIAGVATVIVLAVAVSSISTVVVLGRGNQQTFPGTSAPGSHEFWDRTDVENQFCSQCHEAIRTELDNSAVQERHQGENCAFCHPVGAGEHAASAAQCVDCHSNQAGDLATDPHGSFYGSLGETEQTASWSCKACHTKVTVDMTVTENPALPLDLGPTYP